MLQNAYFLAKIGADTAGNEQHFAEILSKTGNYPTGPPSLIHALQILSIPGGGRERVGGHARLAQRGPRPRPPHFRGRRNLS